MTEFTFLKSAISEALITARQLGCCRKSTEDSSYLLPITGTQINEILMAAWRAQETGDFNVTDLRTTKERLTAEVSKLREQAEQMRNKNRWTELEIDKMQRHIKIILKATRRLHQKRARFVDAWEQLERWTK